MSGYTGRGYSRLVSNVTCVAAIPGGRRVVTVAGCKIKVVDIETGVYTCCVGSKQDGYPQGHFNTVYGVDVFPNGRRFVTASLDKTLKMWEVATGECVATLEGHSKAVNGVGVWPNGVISASSDKTLKVWNVETRKCVATLEGHSLFVRDVAVSPDGRCAVSCDGDYRQPGVVKVWDVATRRCVATLEGHSHGVGSVAMFLEGRRVLSASCGPPWPGVLKVWDIATRKCLATLEGHSHAISDIAAFPNGLRVVSGSADRTLKVWEVATRRCVATLERRGFGDEGAYEAQGVTKVAVTPDGRRVVSGWSDGKTLRVWNVETDECVEWRGQSDARDRLASSSLWGYRVYGTAQRNFVEAQKWNGVSRFGEVPDGQEPNDEDALHYFDEALRIDPNHEFALSHRTTCLWNLGRRAEAVDALKVGLANNRFPNHADAVRGWLNEWVAQM